MHHGIRRNQREDFAPMLLIGLTLLIVLAIAGLITVYVAYPGRGQSIPHAAWLSDAMLKARRKIDA
jgi:hypothetical protein